MTEKFRLAANILLKRRLNNLVRIDDNIEIDRDYITCAEYQLFIDDMRQEGKNPQPDHWTSKRFPVGDAQKPVTGVKNSDAEEFCQWLTQKELITGFSYRLPTLSEVKSISAITEDIGYWCKEANNLVISGITTQQWRIWEKQLSQYLIIRDNFNLRFDLNLDLYRDLDLNLNLNLDLYRDLNRNLNLKLDFYRDLNREIYLNRNLYLNLDFNFNLDLNLYRDLNLNLDFDLDLNLNLNRNLDLDLDLNLYFNLYRKIEIGLASNLLLIYFPLIFIIFFYQLLVIIYRKIAQNIKARNIINLSRQECELFSKQYEQKRDKVYLLYINLVLMDERKKGNMPAWEGIRIVQEREAID